MCVALAGGQWVAKAARMADEEEPLDRFDPAAVIAAYDKLLVKNKEENENSAIDTSKDNTIEKNKDNDMDIDREESAIKEKTEDVKI